MESERHGGGAMIKSLMSLIGLGSKENRCKYERYPIVAPLEVTVGYKSFQCEVEMYPPEACDCRPPWKPR